MGELLSLAFIAATLLALLVAAARTRTVKSFQFQMFLFAAVLFTAEVPRILGTLGVIDVSSFEGVGLEIHSLSMVVLVCFAAFRIYGFLREK